MEVLPREVDVLSRAAIVMSALVAVLAACAAAPTTSGPTAPSSSGSRTGCAFPAAPVGVPWQDRPGMFEPGMLPAAVDTHSGMIVVLQPRATVVDVPVTWTFDVCRNSWQRTKAMLAPDSDVWRLVYHAEADLTLGFPLGEGTVRAYSAEQDSWTDIPTRGNQPVGISDAVYDPDTGRVIGWSDQSATLWSYDLARRTWTVFPRRPGDRWPDLTVRTMDDRTGYTLMTYDTGRHAVLLAVFPVDGRRGSTWAFDVGSARWTDLRSTPPAMLFGYGERGGEIAFDSAHDRAIVISGGDVAVFDSDAGVWSRPAAERRGDALAFDPAWPSGELGGQEVAPNGLAYGLLARTGHTVVYDPASTRVVMLGGSARMRDPSLPVDLQYGWWLTADTWAYDVRDNSWTQLVPEQEPLVMSGTLRPASQGSLR